MRYMVGPVSILLGVVGWVVAVAVKGMAWTFRHIVAVSTMIAGVVGLYVGAETLDRTQRAWVAPVGIEVATTPIPGQPLTIKLQFENVGKEPARQVFFTQPVIGLIPLKEGHKKEGLRGVPYIEGFRWPKNSTCGSEPLGGGKRTYFPNQSVRPYEHVAHVFVGGEAIVPIDGKLRRILTSELTPEIFDKKITFLIQGCIYYKTETIYSLFQNDLPIRKTEYCLFLYPLWDKVFYKGIFTFCPTGNNAN